MIVKKRRDCLYRYTNKYKTGGGRRLSFFSFCNGESIFLFSFNEMQANMWILYLQEPRERERERERLHPGSFGVIIACACRENPKETALDVVVAESYIFKLTYVTNKFFWHTRKQRNFGKSNIGWKGKIKILEKDFLSRFSQSSLSVLSE